MDGLFAVLIAGLVVLAAWSWHRRRGGGAREAETKLLRICLGDTGQVERMIDAEMTRMPGISRAEAASRAVSRYERDNR